MTDTKQKKKKKFTVGLWMDLKTASGPKSLQIWNIQEGKQDGKRLRWFAVVSAIDEDEALQLGQDIYSGKVPISDDAVAA